MPEITLYGSRISPFVEKVARALALKGLEFRAVDLKSPGDLKRWNPVTGKMPVLEIDGDMGSGPTPEFEALISERPALADHMKRVEDCIA